MAIIYSIHYIEGEGADNAAKAADRAEKIKTAYRLAHTAHNHNGVAFVDDYTLNLDPTIAITDVGDSWYIIKIDTEKTGADDTAATAKRDFDTTLFRGSPDLAQDNDVWFLESAAGRAYRYNVAGGKDEYIIDESFSDAVDDDGHTDTRIRITDSGEDVIRFRSDVKIRATALDGTDLLIAFGANTNKVLTIKDAHEDRFIIGQGDSAVEMTLAQFRAVIRTEAGEKDGDTTAHVYVVGADVTTAPVFTYDRFIIYVVGDDGDARASLIRDTYRLAGGDADLSDMLAPSYQDGLDENSDGYWAYVTWQTIGDPAVENLKVQPFTPRRAAGDESQLVFLGGTAAGQTRTISAGPGKDEYYITDAFRMGLNDDTDTRITIVDGGVNVFRFAVGVKISGVESTPDGAFEISFANDADDANYNALRIENAKAGRFILGDDNTLELTSAQFLGLVEGASGVYTVAEVNTAPTDSTTTIHTPQTTTSLFSLPFDRSITNYEAWFIDRHQLVIGDHTPTNIDIIPDRPLPSRKWYLLTYNGLDDTLRVTLSSNGQGTDAVDEIWLLDHLSRTTTTVSGGDGVDRYFITREFSNIFTGGNVRKTTNVTIDDSGMNIYRFRDGVEFQSATIVDGVLEVVFGITIDSKLKINNAAAGSFRFGDTNDTAFTARQFVWFIGDQDASTNYTVVDTLKARDVPGTIAFMEGTTPTPDKSVEINHEADPIIVDGNAGGTIMAEPRPNSGVMLAKVTHNGADATYGTFAYTPNTENTGGEWTYTPNPADRDTLRLTANTTDTITFTATDNNGDTSIYDLEIELGTAGEANRDLVVADQYSGQATAIIHGVLFTFDERSANGNNISIDVSRSPTNTTAVTLLPNTGDKIIYSISLAADEVITPEFLKTLWDTHGDESVAMARVDRINATIIDPDIPDAMGDQILGKYIFRGGADGITDAIANVSDDKVTVLDRDTPTNNDLMASGRLAILDPDDGASGSTVEVVSAGKYGTFMIPETGTGDFTIPGSSPAVMTDKGIFDWTYELDLTDADTLALPGGPGSTTIYDIITLSVTDTGGGISFHDIAIAIMGEPIEISFTIGTGQGAMTHMESGVSTAATAMLTENKAYSNETILANITANLSGAGEGVLTPTIDADSMALGFAYDATTNTITFTGELDFESLTDADADTNNGLQLQIVLTAIGGGGTATHNVLVTIANADDAPVIDSDNITTHSDVSAAQATDVPLDVTPPNNVDATALYYAIDENETPSGALFTIPVADEDTGDTITYMLTDATDANGADVSDSFEINEDTGAVSLKSGAVGTGAVLDHEARAYVRFEITATSDSILAGAGNEKTATQQVILIINDVHEPDPDPMTPDNMPPVPMIDQKIAFNSGDAFVFTRRQLDANDPDTTDADMLIYTLTGLDVASGATAALQTRASDTAAWTALVIDGSGSGTSTFTQAQVDAGHVRLMADGDGTLSLRVSDGVTTVPAVGTDATEITFKLRVAETITATEVGGAGTDGVLNLSGDTAAQSKSVTTGIGNTRIALGAGDDEVDAGLGDDTIDLTQGGEDTVIYRFATDGMGNTIAWSGGDVITGFTPGDDELLLSHIDGGNGASGEAAFIDGLGTGGFVATLTTEYTGGNSGDRTSLDNYDVTGVEIHFAQAVVLPGGVLGGSVLSVDFSFDQQGSPDKVDAISWTDFKNEWLPGEAFFEQTLSFRGNADGKAALTKILGLRGPGADIPVEALRSVAVGDGEANTIDLADAMNSAGGGGATQVGEWVIDGGGGDDMITLGSGTEEVIYRLTIDDSNTITAAPDGSDMVTGFTLGTDSLTFVDTDGAGTIHGLLDDPQLIALAAAFAEVSLTFDGTNYTGITFGIVADNPATTGLDEDESVNLTITFATALDEAGLEAALGITGGSPVALADIFESGSVPTQNTDDTTLSASGRVLIDELFGDGNISLDDSLPAELL